MGIDLLAPPKAPPVAPPGSAPASGGQQRFAGARSVLSFVSGAEGILAVLGFATAALAMGFSFEAARWQPGSSQLPLVVGISIAVAYVIGRIPRPPWYFHLAAVLFGFAVAARAAAAGFLSPRLSWQDQVYSVLARLSDWVDKSLTGRLFQDDLLLAVGLATFLFVLTYACYWIGVRLHAAWLSSALLGGALFGNILFKQNAAGSYPLVWACGCLLLILRISLYKRERFYKQARFAGWQQGQRLSLGAGVVIAGLSAVAFAFAPPVQVNQTLNDLWAKLNGPIGLAKKAYDGIGVPKQIDASLLRIDSFQPTLRFLGPFRPGNDLVMKIRSDRGRYEQGVVFDHYDHTGWTNTRFDQFQNSTTDFATLTGSRDTSRDRDRQQIAQDVIQVLPKGALLFTPPQPLGASVRLKGDGFGDLRSTSIILPNQLYTSASLESVATAEALAAASGAIPQDIRDAFLQLPPDMPDRVKKLAQDQTTGRASAFDKALTLESYVRSYAFDVDVPPPPGGRDGVDWFLFDARKGYSDYMSSSMAVLLRELGIPSRVVAGYSPGQLDPSDGMYHVTEKETHTWTQAYFPGYGWIDFEPTPDNPPYPRTHTPRPQDAGASQASPTIEPNATPTPAAAAGAASSPSGGAPNQRQSNFPWWLIALLVAGGGGLGWFLRSRLRGTPGARLAYARVALLGALLGIRPGAWQTPQEFGRQLQARRRFNPGATDTITALYGADRYGPQPVDARANRRAWTAWQYLKNRLLRPWRKAAQPSEPD